MLTSVFSRGRRPALWLTAAVVMVVVAACAAGPVYGPPQPPAPTSGPMRDVLIVGNSGAGTISFIDPDSFANLGSVNVVPDIEQRLAQINASPITAIAYSVTAQQQHLEKFERTGGLRWADDVVLSPDGTTLYVSRSNLSDVVAIDLTRAGHPVQWHYVINGFHADHIALSPDGSRLVVSVTTSNTAEILDTATGSKVAQFPTGAYPHQNDWTADGQRIYNASIGNVGLGYDLNDFKGDRTLQVIDANTYQVVRTYGFDRGIRPMVFNDDESIAYIQLSYLNGLIKFDMDTGTTLATSDQPLNAFAAENYTSYDVYPHNSAHHGLALSGDRSTLCDVGTIDNEVSLVDADDLSVDARVEVGLLPYWATTSLDGTKCFVTMSGTDEIVVIDYASATIVERIPTGFFPQRNRLGQMPESELDLLNPAVG